MKLPKLKKKEKVPKKEKKEKKNKIKKERKFSIKNAILIILVSLGIIGASGILAFALYIIITSPDFVPAELYNKESSVIYANDGKTEIARLGSDGRESGDIKLITYDDLPEVLIDALIATEDSRFFQHNGFDAARFFKASLGQLAGKNAGGASTLSMQVIKNKFSTKETEGIKGIIRKFSDIYMAVFKLEAVYTKEEIIEFYLNSQWLGGSSYYYYGSITGVEQASKYYFGKSVSDLTLPEAALLVGMFNNPNYYNPYSNPNNAKSRQTVVLNLMERHGYISKDEKEFAESIPIQSLLVDHSGDETYKYQAFVDFVIEQVKKETGDDPQQVPMAIYTTLDTKIQDVLNDLEDGKLYKFANDKVQFGMAITSVVDGSVLALSGGRNYMPQGTNRAVGKDNYDATKGVRLQPGSTAKILFDYGPYIEYLHGSPGTIFLDEKWYFSTGQSVANSNRKNNGAMTMRNALVNSVNVTAVQAFQQVAQEVGIDKIADFVHSLGINYGSTLFEAAAIGGVNCADPLTMSAAYAAFGRGGYYIEPYAFTKVVYLEDDSSITHNATKTRVMSEQTAYLITNMLVTAGSGGVGGNFSISGTEIAAKGGTTTLDGVSAKQWGLSGKGVTPDHWNITYSPDYSIALWYGYDSLGKGKPFLTSTLGINARKGIMSKVATKVYKKNSKFKRPSGISSVTIEKETYPTMLASEFTPKDLQLTEYFVSGYEPSEVSTRFARLSDATNGTASFDGTKITLKWDPIALPDAINPTAIEEMFNTADYWKFYDSLKQQYYDKRMEYINTKIGGIVYQIYLQDSEGNLTELGTTTDNTYTYNVNPSISDYTFVIKTAYSIYKENMSNGLTIKAKANIDTNIPDIGGPTEEIPEENEDTPSDDNQVEGLE